MKKTKSLMMAISACFVFVGIALASGEGEGSHGAEKWIDLGKKTFNFVVLIGLLYWLLAAKIKDFFVGRRAEIKENIEKAAERKTEAEKKFREYSEKLDKASLEIDNIYEMIKAQGVAEKQKIIEDADGVGLAIPAVMKNNIDGACMIFHEKPVAHVFALAIHG
jgi:F-type H+-transporting ATPase subunit b